MKESLRRIKQWWGQETSRRTVITEYIAISPDGERQIFNPDNPVRAAKGPHNNGGLALWEVTQTRVLPLNLFRWRIVVSSARLVETPTGV